MISKTTFGLCILGYIYGYYLILMIPFKLRVAKSGIEITPRNGVIGKLVDLHLVCSVWGRLLINVVLWLIYLVVDVETWEHVLLFGLVGFNFLYATAFACIVKFKDELNDVIKAYILWNKNLAKFFDQPEYIEEDGMEPFLKMLIFWMYIFAPFILPLAMVGVVEYIFEMRVISVPMDFFFGIFGLPFLKKPFIFLIGWYLFGSCCYVSAAFGFCMIFVNSETLWIVKHSRYSEAFGRNMGSIEYKRIHRGLAIMHKIFADPMARILASLGPPAAGFVIMGTAILLQYYKTFPVLLSLYGLFFMLSLFYGLGIAAHYAVKIGECSTLYPNKLKMGAKKADKVFARSCSSFLFKIGIFVTVTPGTYPNIIKDVILANVIDFFLLIRQE